MLLFWGRVLLFSYDWPGPHPISQAGPNLAVIFLLLPLECWGYRHVLAKFLTWVVI